MQAPFSEALRHRLAIPAKYPDDRFSGRGIVTCAGGKRYFTCVWMLIWVLRRVVESKLPIQVWHLGRAEMSEGMQIILEEQGVEVIDAEKIIARWPARVSGGWPLKPYAIAQSRFREVLFLDADTIPLVNPDAVFEWDSYRRHGVLFWPDIVDLTKENPIWDMAGLPRRDCASLESGVLAIDKKQAWLLLDLAVLLNEYWEQAYRYIHGDKDSFLIAAELARQNYAIVDHRPYQFDNDLIQRDSLGKLFLHHRSLSKWNLSGPNRPVCDASIDKCCAAALEELRRLWSGMIFLPPARSAASLAEETHLIAVRRFSYSTSVVAERTLELLPGGRVGEGRAEYEQHWAVTEEKGGLILQLFSATRLAVELHRRDDGTWKGISLSRPAFDAGLVSLEAAQNWPHFRKPRIEHSAAIHIDAMFASPLLHVGFDGEVAEELSKTLTFLNRLFDDVPEAFLNCLSGQKFDESWRNWLESLVRELSMARDNRLAAVRDRACHPVEIDPLHYRRLQ
ncbi:MAG: hypothetical protein E7813_13180 [Bradyrhizobium sp.]|uniref:hypothetical protein n=1 Tax=Bradyrhizobium sp. TaxID=376 RepID=UPI001202F8E6|nr:hypothetical protein [Bradyrhizobium sp.]THD66230.1 MAG: hypothetical protein E7813_13180 [Bradyrhizobium sp.]